MGCKLTTRGTVDKLETGAKVLLVIDDLVEVSSQTRLHRTPTPLNGRLESQSAFTQAVIIFFGGFD